MHIKLVVFDFDGTLVNLNQDITKLRDKLSKLALSYGVQLKFKPILDDIHKLKLVAGEEAYNKAIRIINSDDMQLAEKARLIDSANEICKKLKMDGVKIAIFSRTYSEAIKYCLRKLNFPEFDLIMGRFEGGNDKREQLREILNKLSIPPEKTIVVGDHVIDVKAGKSLRCLSVGIENKRFDKEKLIENGADIVIKDVSELLQVIK